jgi:hypothetical protein
MLNITLNYFDNIDTVLPAVETAMETGEVCQIHNINYLSRSELVALKLISLAENLLNTGTGRTCHSNPGFCLVGIDEYGTERVLNGFSG